MVWDTPIKPKDAIHIATAAYYKVREVHTFDGPLCIQGNVDVKGFRVTIKKPHAEAQTEMYAAEIKAQA